MLVNNFIDEYRRYRKLGENAIAQIDDDALNHVPVGDGNSIAMVMRHVGGNLRSRFTDFLTADGEKPWRDRDNEFANGPFRRADVEQIWKTGFDVLDTQLSGLTDADLQRTVTIRGVILTVHEALSRSIAHTAMHVGQIVLLSKIAAGGSWKTLSIPRGQSAQYNANPFAEKVPK